MQPNPQTILKFAKLIEEEIGIVFQDHNLFQLRTRLEDFGKVEGISSIDEMFLRFQDKTKASFRRKLINLVTNNETSFFRDPTFFKSLNMVVREQVSLRRPHEIRIWSAASSTGQEGLSIAMTLIELAQEISLPAFHILGTDISTKAIDKANSATYSDFEINRGLSEERRAKFFMRSGNDWVARPTIKDRVLFQYNNLLTNVVTGPFDFIFCRNVLIYLNVDRKKTIVQSLVRQLRPGGSLFLGVGETLLGVSDYLEFTNIEGVPVYRCPNLEKKKVG